MKTVYASKKGWLAWIKAGYTISPNCPQVTCP